MRPPEVVAVATARDSIHHGDKLREKGDLSGAVDAYRASLKQARVYEGYTRLADVLIQAGRTKQAIQVYRDLLYPLPTQDELRFPVAPDGTLKGGAWYVFPDTGYRVFHLAHLLHLSGLREEALAAYNQGVREVQQRSPFHTGAYLKSLKFSTATFDGRAFEAAILVGMGLGSDPFVMGTLKEPYRHVHDRITLYRKALRIQPNFTFAYLCLARCYEGLSGVHRRDGNREASRQAEREARWLIRKIIAMDQAKEGTLRTYDNDMTRAAKHIQDHLNQRGKP